ncbi:hypothetical protein [Nocardia salmonicida]|uniref:hypothetical protein n=1 Tax=Nocardia salmonicida TaxID=53431 RepID=UPI0007A432EB|nr:hypothetical protein [Nocardia salmonicida]
MTKNLVRAAITLVTGAAVGFGVFTGAGAASAYPYPSDYKCTPRSEPIIDRAGNKLTFSHPAANGVLWFKVQDSRGYSLDPNNGDSAANWASCVR